MVTEAPAFADDGGDVVKLTDKHGEYSL